MKEYHFIPEEKKSWNAHWNAENACKQAEKIQGNTVRTFKNRYTLHFKKENQSYYLKYHNPLGLFEFLISLLRGGLPVCSAQAEWKALSSLQSVKIGIPAPVSYGRKGWCRFYQYSFIITKDINQKLTVEDYLKGEQNKKNLPAQKRKIIIAVADTVRRMHAARIFHRDLYLCHFYLFTKEGKISLILIDFHRALIRPFKEKNHCIKDLGALYFSAKNAGLHFSNRDGLRFIRAYTELPLRVALNKKASFWKKVRRRGEKVWRREIRKSRK